MKHISACTGIGGFDLAAEWMGWENLLQIEIDKNCLMWLEKNFPNVPKEKNLKEFDGKPYRGTVNIFTAGFPCQPFSTAGKRRGEKDDRYLWDEIVRVTKEMQPDWVVFENVYGISNIHIPTGIFEMADQEKTFVYHQAMCARIIQDLRAIGYEVPTTHQGEPLLFIVPACAVNAWHRRDRIWIIAHHSKNDNQQNGIGGMESAQRKKPLCRNSPKRSSSEHNFNSGWIDIPQSQIINSNFNSKYEKSNFQGSLLQQQKLQKKQSYWTPKEWQGRPDSVTPSLCANYDGIPKGVAIIEAFGNSIIPQIAYQIFYYIQKTENIINNSKMQAQ